MNWIVRGFLALVVVIAVVLLLMGYIDSLAKTGIETGATFALGTKTTLERADVQPFAGRFSIAGLNVSNPCRNGRSFDAEHFLKLGTGDLAVSLGSLMGDTVELPEITLDRMDVILEKSGDATNYGIILKNLGKVGGGGEDEPDDESSGKKFIVGRILLTNIVVRVAMPPVGSTEKPLKLHIPKIEREDFGSDSDKGMVLADLTGIIIGVVLRTLVTEAPAAIPGAMLSSIDLALGRAGNFGKIGGKLVGDISEVGAEVVGKAEAVLKDVGKIAEEIEEVGKKAGEIGDGVKDAAKGVGEVFEELRGVVPGGKKKDKQKK